MKRRYLTMSVGLPFLVVEVASRDALRAAKPNLTAYEGVLPLDSADAIYAYTMGRPSLLLGRTTVRNGEVEAVYIGGTCVAVMEGTFI